jgi:hypothetical protein
VEAKIVFKCNAYFLLQYTLIIATRTRRRGWFGLGLITGHTCSEPGTRQVKACCGCGLQCDAVPIKPMVLRRWRVLWLCRCPKPSCACACWRAWTAAARSRWPLAGVCACTACPQGMHVQGKITVKAACVRVLHYGV